MAYCTVADIRARRGNKMPSARTDTGGKVSDAQNVRVNAAIADATQILHQIVPYVAEAGFSPSADLRATLRTIAVDIAIYRMVDSNEGSEDERKRYEDAIRVLREIVAEHRRGLDGTKIQCAEGVNVHTGSNAGHFGRGRLL